MYRNAFSRFHCTAPRLRSKKSENGAYSGRIAAKRNVFLERRRRLSHGSVITGVPGRGRAGAPLFGRFPFSWFSAIFRFLAFFCGIPGFPRFPVISADFNVSHGNPAFLVAGAEKHDIPKHLLTFLRCHFRRDPHFRGNRGFPCNPLIFTEIREFHKKPGFP